MRAARVAEQDLRPVRNGVRLTGHGGPAEEGHGHGVGAVRVHGDGPAKLRGRLPFLRQRQDQRVLALGQRERGGQHGLLRGAVRVRQEGRHLRLPGEIAGQAQDQGALAGHGRQACPVRRHAQDFLLRAGVGHDRHGQRKIEALRVPQQVISAGHGALRHDPAVFVRREFDGFLTLLRFRALHEEPRAGLRRHLEKAGVRVNTDRRLVQRAGRHGHHIAVARDQPALVNRYRHKGQRVRSGHLGRGSVRCDQRADLLAALVQGELHDERHFLKSTVTQGRQAVNRQGDLRRALHGRGHQAQHHRRAQQHCQQSLFHSDDLRPSGSRVRTHKKAQEPPYAW